MWGNKFTLVYKENGEKKILKYNNNTINCKMVMF